MLAFDCADDFPLHETAQDQPKRSDIPFDWTLRPSNPPAHQLVALAMTDANAIRRRSKKARRRQQRHESAFEAAVSAIVANATQAALRSDSTPIHVSRSKVHLERRDRYRQEGETGAFPQRLDELHEAGWIVQVIAPPSTAEQRNSSTITAGPVLLAHLREPDFQAAAFHQAPVGEVIILKSVKRRQKRSIIDYVDTPQTHSLREEVTRINHALLQADISVTPECADTVDVGHRRLVRSFIDEGFDHGGRFGGGFWVPMSKTDRFAHLRIDGERVVELDFEQLHPHIAYALVGGAAPKGDLYDIPGLETVPRKTRKAFFNALLWDERERRSLVKGTREHFPAHLSGKSAADLVARQHPAIAPLLGTGAGARIMGIESEIMTRIMLDLIEAGITGLPIHDAVLVPASKTFLALPVMREAYRSITGQTIRVSKTVG
ncbi:hypothetical protein [uncultured Maricaulis sp.]|uniref:hypothetical protein n=1 Tax=uncultured Maricaulis sp. TaxID=174710 RepID=UPI0030D968FE|tara:strand:+ start:33308 stop:34609 length:1302 start_codon:yes stop_codon:yes gene_type:complete